MALCHTTAHFCSKNSFPAWIPSNTVLRSCGSVVVSKHGLYVGSPGSILTAVTTMTADGGDAEHVS